MMNPLLDINFLQNNLQNTFPEELFDIDVFHSIDSTNRYLLEKNTGNIHICLAEQQTAGRGRQGKTWVSPYGVNIYCSLLWPFFHNPSELEGLSLIVGIIVARTLKKYGIDQLKLKWPNDVLCQNKKIAGVLIETTNKNNRFNTIIGVGINVFLSRDSLRGEEYAQIDQPWTDVSSVTNFQPNRNQLTLSLLIELFEALKHFNVNGFSMFRSEWNEYDLFRDQPITLQINKGMVDGIARGINDQGQLQLEISGKIETFTCGEIMKARLNHFCHSREGGNPS